MQVRYYLFNSFFYNNNIFCLRYDHIRPKPQSAVSSIELTTTNSIQQDFVDHKTESFTKINNPGKINIEILKQKFLTFNFLLESINYANICYDPSISVTKQEEEKEYSPKFTLQSLCPYAEKDGFCEALETGRYCPYIHGDLCDLCEMPVLHPSNEKQREQHRLVRILN